MHIHMYRYAQTYRQTYIHTCIGCWVLLMRLIYQNPGLRVSELLSSCVYVWVMGCC